VRGNVKNQQANMREICTDHSKCCLWLSIQITNYKYVCSVHAKCQDSAMRQTAIYQWMVMNDVMMYSGAECYCDVTLSIRISTPSRPMLYQALD
jgi:pheromone shutdown protein TraB